MYKFMIVFFLCLSAFFNTSFPSSGKVLAREISKVQISFQNDPGFIGDPYTKEWSVIDSLRRLGLTRSSAEAVSVLLEKARYENNQPQIVKALLYKSRYSISLEENGLILSIQNMEKEIRNAHFPMKQILHSVLAELYEEYYNDNRWQIVNRSETDASYDEDISSWGYKRFFQAISSHNSASLQPEDNLLKIPIERFEEILVSQPASRKFRPTLYDFLAHRALTLYMDNWFFRFHAFSNLLDMDSEKYFNPYQDFRDLEINAGDTLSPDYLAVQVFQKLLKAHSNDTSPEALVHIELKRLNFVHRRSSINNKGSLYTKALETLAANTDRNNEVASEIDYARAQFYFDLGQKYERNPSEENHWGYKKAHDICLKTVRDFPDTTNYGVKMIKSIQKRILRKYINAKVEKVNAPHRPFLMSVTYKNTDRLYLKIIKSEYDLPHFDERESFIEKLKKLEPVRQWEQTLPPEEDFQQHQVEAKIEGLSPGHYYLMVSSSPHFSYEDQDIGYMPFWVSNLGTVARGDYIGATDIFVFDRETGEPMSGVIANFYKKEYNEDYRSFNWELTKTFTTDGEGGIHLSPVKNREEANLYMELINGEDRFKTGEPYYLYKDIFFTEEDSIKTILFTDRSIYRPGQEIYFKGIVIEKDGNQSVVKSNYSSMVSLYNLNGNIISEIQVTTNDYGSFSGSFILPNNGIHGFLSIREKHGRQNFAVEEYKRPTIQVLFDPVSGSYKPGDELEVSGKASTYSEAPISGASVSYKIFYGKMDYQPTVRDGYLSEKIELTSGIVVTDPSGQFNISFSTISQKGNKEVYLYEVIAEVTDINGETRSDKTQVLVSERTLSLSIDVPEKVNRSKKDVFLINSANLSGEFNPAKGSVTVYKLKMPNQYFRERMLGAPDRYQMDKEEFKKDFPHDEYGNENDHTTWEREKRVFQSRFDTEKQKGLELKRLKKWKPGMYVIEVVGTDRYGGKENTVEYFTVFDENNDQCPTTGMDWFIPVKTKAEPGEKAVFMVGSPAKNVKILYEIEHKGEMVHKEWITINAEQRKVEIPVEEKHRGNFSVHFTFVKHGRSLRYSNDVTVPFTNNQLALELSTFRNKLLPGQQEEWSLTLKEPGGTPAMAEVLASMYDASLNAFVQNKWHFDFFEHNNSAFSWNMRKSFSTSTLYTYRKTYPGRYQLFLERKYDQLLWNTINIYRQRIEIPDSAMVEEEIEIDFDISVEAEEVVEESLGLFRMGNSEEHKYFALKGDKEKGNMAFQDMATPLPVGRGNMSPGNIQVRKNFNETAFFYPHLSTNTKGETIIKFTIPESLTKWKFRGLAHTPDLKWGEISGEAITQKDLMVYPNAPRFFRENDRLQFSTKVVNLTDKDMEGKARIDFFDALTMKPVTEEILTGNGETDFKTGAGGSTEIKWDLVIPEGYQAITYRVVAQAGNFSDGQEMAIPVLTNQKLVTEPMPFSLSGKGSHSFSHKKLVENNSTTLKHHKLTLEFTSNPAWYAIQSLPYMMEYPYECAEQTFNRYYANSVAAHIAQSSPRIQSVFESWKGEGQEAFLSNLEKNQELKSLILEETPWVMEARDEQERKKRLGLLLDAQRMKNEKAGILEKLWEAQGTNGGWPWFEGMHESRYITQYIMAGFGHLQQLGVTDDSDRLKNMLWWAVKYMDNKIVDDFHTAIEKGKPQTGSSPGYVQVQYLYARSYFMKSIPPEGKTKPAWDYFMKQAQKTWVGQSRYMQGMLALAFHRSGREYARTAQQIMASLKENAIRNKDLGMYWKEENSGFYWYEAPVETQALLIEAFHEVTSDTESVEAMKLWLLKNKQTNNWSTTVATAEACYALLLTGTDLLHGEGVLDIEWGGEPVIPEEVEAGTGYFKVSKEGEVVSAEMGNVTVNNQTGKVAWGALYWQYFEQLDKITPHQTPLNLKKQLFLKQKGPSGTVLVPIEDNTTVQRGDKIVVRIVLKVDRDMEYVHLKDMRASGAEPVNVFSGYRYQNGLGYYETTKDASTNFFFDRIRKGTYVFEYKLTANISGIFSNGITSIQCMYAPEFAAHSEGVRLRVE